MKRPSLHAAVGMALGLSLSVVLSARGDDTTSPTKLAQQLVARGVTAFNAHSAEGFAEQYSVEADVVTLAESDKGRHEYAHVEGRAPIRNAVDSFLARYPKARMEKSVQRARLLTPDVLFVDCLVKVKDLGPEQPIEVLAVLVFKKTGDSWQIVAERLVADVPGIRGSETRNPR